MWHCVVVLYVCNMLIYRMFINVVLLRCETELLFPRATLELIGIDRSILQFPGGGFLKKRKTRDSQQQHLSPKGIIKKTCKPTKKKFACTQQYYVS